MNNIYKYLLAYLPNRLFVEKSTGALFSTDGMFDQPIPLFTKLRHTIAGYGGVRLYTRDPMTLTKGIAASTSYLDSYKDMEDFEYIGKI